MSRRDFLRRIANVIFVVVLWWGACYFWYWRSYYAFYTFSSRLPTNLAIPAGIEVVDPEPERDCRGMYKDSLVCDEYARTMFQAASITTSPTTVACNISALDYLYKENPELILRYMATSPAWGLQECRDVGRCATRRYRWIDGCWHGQFDCSFIPPRDEDGILKTHIIVYFDGEDIYGQRCMSGERVEFMAKQTDDNDREITVVCQGTNLSMVVTEYGPRGPSRLMQPTFNFLQQEFENLAAAGNWERAKDLLPEGSMRRSAAELKVFTDLVGNLSYEAWVNPGEKGKVYLKAFEVTKNISLTLKGVGGAPIEYVGWSDDPEEKFYASDDFGFHEYSEENDFAVRLEMWFIPANGGLERKLIERVFRVKGKEQ